MIFQYCPRKRIFSRKNSNNSYESFYSINFRFKNFLFLEGTINLDHPSGPFPMPGKDPIFIISLRKTLLILYYGYEKNVGNELLLQNK